MGSFQKERFQISTLWQMIPMGQLSMKKMAAVGQAGKLWRWKRSHHQWILQFKWKWQKPWRLSEWIRHSDETIIKARPRPQPLPDMMWSCLCAKIHRRPSIFCFSFFWTDKCRSQDNRWRRRESGSGKYLPEFYSLIFNGTSSVFCRCNVEFRRYSLFKIGK